MNAIDGRSPDRGDETDTVVLRRSRAAVLEIASGERWRQLLVGHHDAAFIEVTFPPKTSGDHDCVRHPAREYLYLVHGTLHIEIDGNVQTLHAGDSIAFAANVSHRIWNESAKEATAIRFTAAVE